MVADNDDKDSGVGGDPPTQESSRRKAPPRLTGPTRRFVEDLLWELWASNEPRMQSISVKLKARYL